MIYDREECANWPDMTGNCCIVCGKFRTNTHHIPPIGTGKRKAWKGALVSLCGSGDTGCHGLFHAGKLELRVIDGQWYWRLINAQEEAEKDWTECHDDAFWDTLGAMTYGL